MHSTKQYDNPCRASEFAYYTYAIYITQYTIIVNMHQCILAYPFEFAI